MEGDVCSFPPESSDDRSQRGSVASSATLSHSQDVLIYLFGDSAVHLSVEGLGNVTVQELGRSVREALHVPECAQDTFAFWLSSPLLVDDAISLTLEFDRFFLGNIKLLHLIVWRLVSESYWKRYNFSLVLNGLEVLFGSQGGTKFLGRNQELQLKARHQPYKVCRQWQDLLYRFTEASEEDISQDEPCLQYRRNVFYPKFKELQIEDEGVLRLLYEEAKHNIITGRYPCDPEHWASLGGLSLALDEGTGLERQKLTSAIREKKLSSFLPAHVAMASGGLFSTLRGKSSRQAGLEQSLLEEYRKINISVDCQQDSELIHQYLRTCHSLPYYGCAFFDGEIDKPAQGILQRVKRKAVAVGISLEGVYVMDVKDKHVLLGLRFYELSWDHSSPEEEGDSHILWLEFDGDEDGTPVNKLLKIYSKQAELMSGFIEFCVELRSVSEGGAAAEIDGDSSRSQQASGKDDGEKRGRGGRRGMLRRQSSVVCSRVHSLNTINYVDNGKEIKCLKPKRAASFFTRQTSGPMYSSVQVTESSEQG